MTKVRLAGMLGSLLLLCMIMCMTACSNQSGNDNVIIEDVSVPLEETPNDLELPADSTAAKSGGQTLVGNTEITSTLKSPQEAPEEELLSAAREVIAMYETGEFKGDNLKATRYPPVPDGCSIDQIRELVIEENFFLYPYAVTADLGNVQMIMGIEYVSAESATADRPEGWHIAAVLFRPIS